MVAKEYVEFEAKTKVPKDEFIARQAERKINLSHSDCLSVENVLKEYERTCHLIKLGEGKRLPTKLRKLEDAIRSLKTSIDAVDEEEGYIWDYLVEKANFDVNLVERLLKQCENLNKEIPRRTKANMNAFPLERLLNKLAAIYTEATGHRATISKGAATKRDAFPGGRGGRFAHFARSAIQYLPDQFRPTEKTLRGIGSRFERTMRKQRAGSIGSPNWVGLPYPALTQPNWKNSALRQLRGKRP